MTQSFFLGQLRLALVAIIAYAGGKGWLTPTDAGLATAMLTSLGPLLGPWLWSIYANINSKLVPQHAVVIDPVVTFDNALNQDATVKTASGTVTGKVIASLLIAFVLSVLVAGGSAQAQVKLKPPQITGNFAADAKANFGSAAAASSDQATALLDALAKPFQDIATFIGSDADQAVSLSTVIPEIQDGHGQQCWMAMALFGKIIKAHPVPLTFHVINDFETLRLLGAATNRLCANVHCTQVFADASSMAQAASPTPLLIPTLHDLCTKVPQIALVDPVATPPAPATDAVAPTPSK